MSIAELNITYTFQAKMAIALIAIGLHVFKTINYKIHSRLQHAPTYSLSY